MVDRRAYAEAEEVAREGRKGLWGGDQPVPPWEFRRARVISPTLY